MYTLFSERSFFWAFFHAQGRDIRLSLIFFSFFSLAACTIYLTGWIKSNGSETNDKLPKIYVAINGIYILLLCFLGLILISDIYYIVLTIFLFVSAVILIFNLRTNARRLASPPLAVLAGFICFMVSFYLSPFILEFNSFLSSVLYFFVLLFLFLSAIKCVGLFRFTWAASAIWLVGLAIFMFGVNMPPTLITDQMRLSSDGRFSYRIEIVDRGRNSEHVRLFTHEVETGNESTIILPELSGTLVSRDRERFGGFVLWEDDMYILFLDRRMWSGDTNWLAINEIDMSTENAVPFSVIDRRELFQLAHDLWLGIDIWFIHRNSYFRPEAWEWSDSNYPSFAEVIQVAEMLGLLSEYSYVHSNLDFVDLLHGHFYRNNSGVSFVEFVELERRR